MFLTSAFLAGLLLLAPATAQEGSSAAEAVGKGDWPRAERLAQSALLRDRRDPATWTYLGLAQDHLGRHSEALVSFLQAVRLAPHATYALNNLGGAFESNHQPFKAAAEYRRSLALDDRQPAALVNLARLLSTIGEGQQTEVRGLLTKAWALAPDSELARSLLTLAPCASRAGPSPKPVAEVQPYIELSLQGSHGANGLEQTRVAHTMLACGYAAEAKQMYSSLLEDEPANPTIILGLAQAQFALGQDRAAGMTLERAVAGGVESAPIYALLGNTYEATGNLDHAVDALKRAVEFDPADAAIRFRYSLLLLNAHAPKAAELRTREAIQHFPDSATLWFALGLAQFDENDPAHAQQSLDRSIALDPHFTASLTYRGLCALDQQRYSEAALWYGKAIAQDSDAADLHFLLAEAIEHEHPDDRTEVRAELEKSLKLDPNLAISYLALGRIDLQEGRPEDAVIATRQALALDPSLHQAHFYLSRAFWQLHDSAQANAEAKLFGEERASVEAADREAFLARVRQLSNTTF